MSRTAVLRAAPAPEVPADQINVVHPRTALALQRARIEAARSVRADIAASVDRAEALRRADTYLNLLDEHHANLVRLVNAMADEE